MSQLDLETTVQELLKQVSELSSTVAHQGELIKSLQAANEQFKTQISQLVSPDSALGASVIEEDDIPTFTKFLDINRNATKRIAENQEREKLRNLYEIFRCIRQLSAIGAGNEKVFALLNFYYKIVEGIQPREEGYGLFNWWWSSATQEITFDELEEILTSEINRIGVPDIEKAHIGTIFSIIKQLKDDSQKLDLEKKDTKKTDSIPLPSMINSVKDKICSLLDRSGVEICERLRDLFEKINESDPAAFLEEHCGVLLGETLSESEKDRLLQFAETFVVGNDWVHVPTDGEAWSEPSWFSWTCSRIRNSCQLYGRSEVIDGWLDVAHEYKTTCGAVKTSLEWIYFGGRFAVDPAGAALTLLW